MLFSSMSVKLFNECAQVIDNTKVDVELAPFRQVYIFIFTTVKWAVEFYEIKFSATEFFTSLLDLFLTKLLSDIKLYLNSGLVRFLLSYCAEYIAHMVFGAHFVSGKFSFHSASERSLPINKLHDRRIYANCLITACFRCRIGSSQVIYIYIYI